MEGYSTQYLYRIPDDTLQEGGKLKKAEIFTGEVYVTTNEISDVIAVGIPETGESAPEKVEFRDSVLTLTGKRIKDREAGTDESGEKIMNLPSASISRPGQRTLTWDFITSVVLKVKPTWNRISRHFQTKPWNR